MPRIIVLGSINVDLVVELPRLPGAGETISGARLRTFSGGKGANQAVAASRLGGQAAMLGRVGSDAFGDAARDNLLTNGVDASGVVPDPSEPTGAALIMVGPRGQNLIALAPGANARVGSEDVERAASRLRRGDLLVMQHEIPSATVAAGADAARRAGAHVLLNAHPPGLSTIASWPWSGGSLSTSTKRSSWPKGRRIRAVPRRPSCGAGSVAWS